MNRIIFYRNHPANNHLYQLAIAYDYAPNPEAYACIDVDSETLCYLKLRHSVWKHKFEYFSEMLPVMPTYVCHYEPT